MNVQKTKNLNLCVSCEACSYICPSNAITMKFQGGQYLPFVDSKKCTLCGKCLKVCPGINIDDKHVLENSFSFEKIAGNCLKAYVAHSKNSEIRKQASSGGLITTLISNLIKNKEIYGAFVLEDDGSHKAIARLKLAKTENEVIKSAKSKYIPVSVYNVLLEIKENPEKRYAVVGTPCQFSAIKKILENFNISEENLLFLGLLCDRTLNYNIVKYFEKKYGKKNEKLIRLDFRNKKKSGWPGNLMLYFDSDRKVIVDRDRRREVKPFFNLERCVYCLDNFNCSADIAFGDCYVAGKENKKGKSSVLIRTEKGKDIFDRYSDLFEFEEINSEKIIFSQNIDGKRQNYLRAKYLSKENNISDKKDIFPESDAQFDLIGKKLRQIRRNINWGRKNQMAKIKLGILLNKYEKRFESLRDKIYLLVLLIAIVLGDLFKKNIFYKSGKKINKVLIIGGTTKNKGGQAMLFSVINNINKKFGKVNFYIFSDYGFEESREDKNNFKFDILKWNPHIKLDLIAGKNKNDVDQKKVARCLREVDLAIDISGYALSSQWVTVRSLNYLLNILIMKKYRIPFYIFPQSMGPFNYSFLNKLLLFPLFFIYLKYPVKIFPREKEGEMWVKRFTRDNVERSFDIVFQNEEYLLDEVYHKAPGSKEFDIEPNSVGIIPNTRIFEQADKGNDLYLLYKKAIESILATNRNVYIFRHSTEDLDICRKIKNIFKNNGRVSLIEDDLNVIELENIIRKLDFVIASRYHSIVHAYKNNVPAVVIGWAIKYYELLGHFNQLNYFLDCRQKIESDLFDQKLNFMVKKYKTESEIIQSKINILKTKNPFDRLI